MEAKLYKIHLVDSNNEILMTRHRLHVKDFFVDEDATKGVIELVYKTDVDRSTSVKLDFPITRTYKDEYSGNYSFAMDIPLASLSVFTGQEAVNIDIESASVSIGHMSTSATVEDVYVDAGTISLVRVRVKLPSGVSPIYAIPINETSIGDVFRSPMISIENGEVVMYVIPSLGGDYNSISQVYIYGRNSSGEDMHCIATFVHQYGNDVNEVVLDTNSGVTCSRTPPSIVAVDPVAGGRISVQATSLSAFADYPVPEQAEEFETVISDVYKSGWLSHVFSEYGAWFVGIDDALKKVFSRVDEPYVSFSSLTSLSYIGMVNNLVSKVITPWENVEKMLFSANVGYYDPDVAGTPTFYGVPIRVVRLFGNIFSRENAKVVGRVVARVRRDVHPPVILSRSSKALASEFAKDAATAMLRYRALSAFKYIALAFPKLKAGIVAVANAGKFLIKTTTILFVVGSVTSVLNGIVDYSLANAELSKNMVELYKECLRRNNWSTSKCEGVIKLAKAAAEHGGGGWNPLTKLSAFFTSLPPAAQLLLLSIIVLIFVLLLTR